MLQFVLTGIVNLLTYLSVTITTGTNTSLLSAIFLFSASIGLEALSLWHDNDRAITPELEHRKSGYVERKRRPYQGNVVRIA